MPYIEQDVFVFQAHDGEMAEQGYYTDLRTDPAAPPTKRYQTGRMVIDKFGITQFQVYGEFAWHELIVDEEDRVKQPGFKLPSIDSKLQLGREIADTRREMNELRQKLHRLEYGW